MKAGPEKNHAGRYVTIWAAVLMTGLVVVVAVFAIPIARDRAQIRHLALRVAHRERALAQRPIIDARLAALRNLMAQARPLGVTVPVTAFAGTVVQDRLTGLLKQQAAIITTVSRFTTRAHHLRLLHVTVKARIPLARLQPTLNALAALPWALRVTHLTIHRPHKGMAPVQMGFTLPIFRTAS